MGKHCPTRGLLYNTLLECTNKEDVEAGRRSHYLLVQRGLETDSFFGTHLIRMYAACGSLPEANRVFAKLPDKSVFTWGAVILAHVKCGQHSDAIELYDQMLYAHVHPDAHVFVGALRACGSIECLAFGTTIHGHIVETAFGQSQYLASSLIDMYAKCGNLENAQRVFDMLHNPDIVTWNALMVGCLQCDAYHEVLRLFKDLAQGNLKPDAITFSSVLKACVRIGGFNLGGIIDSHIIEACKDRDLLVANAIIDMYVKSGAAASAYHIFEKLPSRNVVSWCTIITACLEGEQEHDALELFMHMQSENVMPDGALFKCVLKACSRASALGCGMLVHAYVCEVILELYSDIGIGNVLVDMYSKCASLEDARVVFHGLPKHDIITWNAMIGGLANCNSSLVFEYCSDLCCEGFEPDEITFICLLCACNNLQQTDHGCYQFNTMWLTFGITPLEEHYNCMVDLLGNAGQLKHAEDVLLTSPYGLSVVGLMSLLIHGRMHGHVELAQHCVECLALRDERKSSGYIHLFQLHSCDGFLCEADSIEELRRSSNAWRKPGVAVTEIGHQTNVFHTAETDLLECDPLADKLKGLHVQLHKNGYLPLLDSVLQTMMF